MLTITMHQPTLTFSDSSDLRDRLPAAAEMYRAFAARDLTQVGHFVMGVKTTGIFCRPGCTARLPRRDNVEFFATPRDAVFSGYRACLRCRPMDAPTGDDAPEWLDRLKRRADENPGQRLRDADLRAMNLDPSTVRRWFKARYGMTFQAYARARRMGLALAAVRAGSRPELAKSRGGYASDSGFREAFTKLFGSAPKSGSAEAGTRVLSARWIETPLGPMLALADDAGLRLLDFIDRRGLERQIARIRTKLGCVIVPGEHRHLDSIARELDRYFAGQSRLGHPMPDGKATPPISVPLVPGGGETPFQRQVWDQLRSIPVGRTRSYAEQARAIGNPKAVRAVARANGENFLGIVIPCHRVIGSDGSMTGYGGGVWRKQWLLDHERKF
jgi:AraC family transcriptional regulator of adaptative response/methylated-DNA-[protein]-cysteine methyltransferase